MPITQDSVADVEADILAAEGAFHVNGTYYAHVGDADLVRHRLATCTAATIARVRAWTSRGARIDGIAIRPAPRSAPTLFERCAWCGLSLTPGEPTLTVVDRHLHDAACREAFDRLLAEGELARAQATLRFIEV